MPKDSAKAFYDREFSDDGYGSYATAESHSAHPYLVAFIEKCGLSTQRVVEIGCGRGLFQDLVDDYTGVDYSSQAGTFLHKPFVEASATALPFEDNSFDAAWTVWVLEHVPDPEQAFAELRRVIKPGGLLYLAPAWYCRSWAARGYPVRPYSDFGVRGKLIKASLPVRDTVLWRSVFVLPRRLVRAAERVVRHQPTKFRYRTLEPNYDTFWMADSDAVNSMDPYEALIWFTSRGDECLNYPSGLRRFFVRGGPIVLRIGDGTAADS